MRSRKSMMAPSSGDSASATTVTAAITGLATDQPQSESSSMIAVWNSSSRFPRGMPTKVSNLPSARATRIVSRDAKPSQPRRQTRRAVGAVACSSARRSAPGMPGRLPSAAIIATGTPSAMIWLTATRALAASCVTITV